MSTVLFHSKQLGNLLKVLRVYVMVQFLYCQKKTTRGWQGVSPVTKQEEGERTEERCEVGNTEEKRAQIY